MIDELSVNSFCLLIFWFVPQNLAYILGRTGAMLTLSLGVFTSGNLYPWAVEFVLLYREHGPISPNPLI